MREWWWTARQREDDLDDEIAHDLQLDAQMRAAAGEAPADAEGDSRRDFGDIGRIKAATRRSWDRAGRPSFLSGTDLRQMTRFIRSHRGYALLASGTLALSVGLNVLVFAIVNALWLRPLPVADPGRVVTVLQRSAIDSLDRPSLKVFKGPIAGQVVTTGLYEAFRAQIALAQVEHPLETIAVTPLYFTVLGLQIRGRTFADADDRPGAEPVAVISDRLWTSGFGRNPSVIGSVVSATPHPLRIIGIAPTNFEGARRGEHADMWISRQLASDLAVDDRQIDKPGLLVYARLSPSENVADLQRRYQEHLPLQPDGTPNPNPSSYTLAPLTDVYGTADSPSMLIREQGPLGVVSGLSFLVLLGGCATLAALVLSHYERRRPELAIKASLGASRGRLVRELVAESLVVGAVGVLGAAGCATLGARGLPALSLPGGVNIGRLDLTTFDWRLWTATVGAVVATLIAACAAPLWHGTHRRLAGEVASSPPTTTVDALRTRRRLLALQVAATTVVLIASGLFVHTVLYTFRVAAGFDIDRTVFVAVEEKGFSWTTTAELEASIPSATARGLARKAQLTNLFAHLPLVQAVAGGAAPIGADARGLYRTSARTLTADGRDHKLLVGLVLGTPNLLSTMGVPILAGRALTNADNANTKADPFPLVITRSLAERLWPSGNAVGQTFLSQPNFPRRALVVGVAGDFAVGTLLRPVDGALVTARGDTDFTTTSLILETDDPRTVAAAATRALPDRVVRVSTGRELVARDIAQQRLGAWAFSGFGMVALLLGIGGVFGLVAYLAQARRREFGIRMALGATLPDVMYGAASAALGPVAVGLAVGLLVGALVSRAFTASLVGVGGLDVTTYLVAGLVLLVPATLAALVAASRLRGLTPADELRRA